MMPGDRSDQYTRNFLRAPASVATARVSVLKVEPPEGDISRCRGPFYNDVPDINLSGLFLYLNADKKGVTLDLTMTSNTYVPEAWPVPFVYSQASTDIM